MNNSGNILQIKRKIRPYAVYTTNCCLNMIQTIYLFSYNFWKYFSFFWNFLKKFSSFKKKVDGEFFKNKFLLKGEYSIDYYFSLFMVGNYLN